MWRLGSSWQHSFADSAVDRTIVLTVAKRLQKAGARGLAVAREAAGAVRDGRGVVAQPAIKDVSANTSCTVAWRDNVINVGVRQLASRRASEEVDEVLKCVTLGRSKHVVSLCVVRNRIRQLRHDFTLPNYHTVTKLSQQSSTLHTRRVCRR